ncbi:hypothetical protein SBV1_1980004 [Verrucomicrobia bacterium]|nr:hypothetical protein SBV1_1980004 [Verrucomicrobiota bacterium]
MTNETRPERTDCGPACCGRTGGVNRRDFLRLAGLTATSTLMEWPAIAGPFEEADFQNLIPADKKLRPEWVKSLFERGEPTLYRGVELEKIGMPVGGICCGQMYLGGDGRLWHWDIFNLPQPSNFTNGAGQNYAKPPKPDRLIDQGFAIKLTGAGLAEIRRLDSAGFKAQDIAFRGQYPMAFVDFRDASLPVSVSLEAFSPFVPLSAENSSLPVTVMHYTVRNVGATQVEVELAGWLENAVCLGAAPAGRGQRRNQLLREPALTMLHSTAESLPDQGGRQSRPDIVFEDFENGYGNWTVEGLAFGSEPAAGTLPNQNPVTGFRGKHLVNSYCQGDQTTGRLVSKRFAIARRCIAFLMGGGRHPGETCMNLVVDGQVVRTATGHDREVLEWDGWEVTEFEGREARLEIVDKATGPWGHINVDQITFTDSLPTNLIKLEQREDYGSMGLALLGDPKGHFGHVSVDSNVAVFAPPATKTEPAAVKSLADKLVGAVGRKFTLAPGEEAEATFLVTWFFPGLRRAELGPLEDVEKLHRHYSKRFDSAAAVTRHVAANFDALAGQTRLWNQTPASGTRPGMIQHCPIGFWIEPSLPFAPWRPIPVTNLTMAASMPLKASIAARELASMCGTTPSRWGAFFPNWSAICAGAPISAPPGTRMARSIIGGSVTGEWRTTASVGSSFAPGASTRCRPTRVSYASAGRVSASLSSISSDAMEMKMG